jgi:hypothetical protein
VEKNPWDEFDFNINFQIEWSPLFQTSLKNFVKNKCLSYAAFEAIGLLFNTYIVLFMYNCIKYLDNKSLIVSVLYVTVPNYHRID